MSYIKRQFEDLQEEKIFYDAEYTEYLREQKRDMLIDQYLEENHEEFVTVRKSDETLPVKPSYHYKLMEKSGI